MENIDGIGDTISLRDSIVDTLGGVTLGVAAGVGIVGRRMSITGIWPFGAFFFCLVDGLLDSVDVILMFDIRGDS
jgi:hypothetical protein